MEVVYLLVGVVIGAIVTYILHRRAEAVGTLEVDYTNPEADLFRLKIDEDLENLVTKKYVLIKVQNNSQK